MPLAQNGGNTRLGRNWGTGIIRGVRPLVFVQETGFRNVDPNATWIPGQFVTLDSQGRVTAFQLATDRRIGIAKTSKGAPFYLPYTQELEWAMGTLTLDKSNVRNVRITTLDGLTAAESPTHYGSINGVNGTIVNPLSVAPFTYGVFVRVTYMYKDMDHAPFDQTLASGKAALFESNGEYAFEVYDTSVGYAVGNYVKLTAEGIITIETNPSTPTVETVGFVTRAPSADDVTLGVKITVF
jgi:hypothetical protein